MTPFRILGLVVIGFALVALLAAVGAFGAANPTLGVVLLSVGLMVAGVVLAARDG